MREAARGVPTMVWFNYRRVPAIAFARQLIEMLTQNEVRRPQRPVAVRDQPILEVLIEIIDPAQILARRIAVESIEQGS